jgi:SSS family solute:Na+ symporter
MWVVNLNYWGCNQYITQRALGADLPTARSGILFAAFLKMLMPLIVVIPGIAAYILWKEGMFQVEMLKDGELSKDNAYPVLLNLLPSGLKGLSFAALTAAVVASLAGKANSISTIFTLDIYKKFFNVNADEKHLVSTGRIAVVVAMVIAVIISPFLGIDKKGGFEFIQEYTGFVSPGIFAMFIMGFFWRNTTTSAAMFAIIGGFASSVILKFIPGVVDLSFLSPFGLSVPVVDAATNQTIYEIPFLDRMGLVFIICIIGMVVISLSTPVEKRPTHTLEVDSSMFRTSKSFAIGAGIILVMLIFLYSYFW